MTLHWNTVSPTLQVLFRQLMSAPEFSAFRLVGGTALSLYLGHRMSVDIDLFTDAPYGSIDFDAIVQHLRATYPYVSTSNIGEVGMGQSYFVGNTEAEAVKLDLYYTDPFIYPMVETADGLRLAAVEDIVAMKVEVVANGGRMKDFWDLHELLNKFPFGKMLGLHRERYPYGHDEALIRERFADFSYADQDFEPECLQGKDWELIKLDILEVLGA